MCRLLADMTPNHAGLVSTHDGPFGGKMVVTQLMLLQPPAHEKPMRRTGIPVTFYSPLETVAMQAEGLTSTPKIGQTIRPRIA